MPVLRTVLLIAVLLLGWMALRGGLHLSAAASPVPAQAHGEAHGEAQATP